MLEEAGDLCQALAYFENPDFLVSPKMEPKIIAFCKGKFNININLHFLVILKRWVIKEDSRRLDKNTLEHNLFCTR